MNVETMEIRFKYRLGSYVSILGQNPPLKYIIVSRGYIEDISGTKVTSYLVRSCGHDLRLMPAFEHDLLEYSDANEQW